jgi:transcription antitermination factor NusA-like protein
MKACQQLVELTTERQLSSYSAEVRAKPQHHKFLIGKNGVNIKKIRDLTGARIVFPTDKDEDKEAITIIGKKEAVEHAKAALEAAIKEIVSNSNSNSNSKYGSNCINDRVESRTIFFCL